METAPSVAHFLDRVTEWAALQPTIAGVALVGSHALQELYRVLAAHAPLLLALHGGSGEVHTENWFGQGMSIDATLFTAKEMMGYLHEAEFQLDQVVERDPYAFEYQSRRVYILARKEEPRADDSPRSPR